MDIFSHYRVLPGWSRTQDRILEVLRSCHDDEAVTLPTGLQHVASLQSKTSVYLLTTLKGNIGDMFIVYTLVGTKNYIKIWTLTYGTKTIKTIRFQVETPVAKMIFASKPRVFVGYCTDLTIRVFADPLHKFRKLSVISCPCSLICMAYNVEMDEFVAGGVGCLLRWSLADYPEKPAALPPYNIKIGREEWVQNLKFNFRNKKLMVQCDSGVRFIDYVNDRETHYFENHHYLALSSAVSYPSRDSFITASKDGSIKVWNTIVFEQVFEFDSHCDAVTGLELHPFEPYLISSSLDGTIRIWRLDTYELSEILRIGEPVLGLKMINTQELAYVTETAIKICRINMHHSLFTQGQLEVETMSRVLHGYRFSRLLILTQDGSVSLVSPVTGATLTIVYPMATHKAVADIVYDAENANIYMVFDGEGEALVFSCADNPSQLTHKIQPQTNDKHIVAMAVISPENHVNRKYPEESLVFAGHRDGTISLLSANSCTMVRPMQAHDEAIGLLSSSRGVCDPNRPAIGWYDRLISASRQGTFKIWDVGLSDVGDTITLQCLKKITEFGHPQHISMMAHFLAFSLEDQGTLFVYDLGEVGGDGHGSPPVRQTHEPEDDHTEELNGLDNSPQLGLFASSSDDGILKVWNEQGDLLREIVFNSSLRGVCFANTYGDLLFGFEHHLYYVVVAQYLPSDRLEEILLKEFKDDAPEKPVEFNHALKRKLDSAAVKALPLDLEERRSLGQCVDTLPPTPAESILSLIPSSYSYLTTSGNKKGLNQQFNIELHYQKLKDRKTSLAQLQNVSLSQEISVQDATDVKEDLEAQTKEQASPEREKDAQFEEEVTEDEMSVKTQKPAEDGAGGTKVEESKPKRYYPIAPDGYIPNSVVRKVLKFEPPPDVIKDTWKLKPVPKQVTFGADDKGSSTSDVSRSASVSSPESFVFENEKDEVSDLDKVVSSTEELKSESDSDVSSTKSKTTISIKAVLGLKTQTPKTVPKSPRKVTSSRPKKTLGKKGGFSISEEEEEPPEVKEEKEKEKKKTTKEEEEECHWLLEQITKEQWFPRNTPKTVPNIVSSFMEFMGNVDDAVHTKICDYIVQIHNDKELGLNDDQLKKLVDKLKEQLEHQNPTYRKNAVRTLKELGVNDFKTVMSIVPLLVDEKTEVRKEAADALKVLAGIDNKDKLRNVFKDMGILQEYSSKQDEEEALAALVKKTGLTSGGDYELNQIQENVKAWMGSSSWTIDMEDEEGKHSTPGSTSPHTPTPTPRPTPTVINYPTPDITPTISEHEVTPVAAKKKKAEKKPVKTGGKETEEIRKKEIILPDKEPQRKKKTESIQKKRDASPASDRSFFSRTGKKLLPNNPNLFKIYRAKSSASETSDNDDTGLSQYKDEPEEGDTKLPAIDETHQHLTAPSVDDEKDTGVGTDRDSDILSLAPTNYDNIFPPVLLGTDNMSFTDSGIQSDVQSQASHRGRHEDSLVRRGKPHLSPIKSSALVEPVNKTPVIPEFPENWRDFFDRPSARQRKQLAEQRELAAESRGTVGTSLPPIQYFDQGELVVQPEAGVRLLQAVTYTRNTSGMSDSSDASHRSVRVHDIPGKLSVHTTSRATGSSKFGVLNLKWVTGQAVSDGESTPKSTGANLPRLQEKSTDRLSVSSQSVAVEAVNANFLPGLATGTKARSMDFAWQKPLPPPPMKDGHSLNPSQRKNYQHYCDYYSLLKKGMHKHTSGTNLIQSTPKIAMVKVQKAPWTAEAQEEIPGLSLKMMLLCKT